MGNKKRHNFATVLREQARAAILLAGDQAEPAKDALPKTDTNVRSDVAGCKTGFKVGLQTDFEEGTSNCTTNTFLKQTGFEASLNTQFNTGTLQASDEYSVSTIPEGDKIFNGDSRDTHYVIEKNVVMSDTRPPIKVQTTISAERLCLSLNTGARLLLAHLIQLNPRWINLSHTRLCTIQGKVIPYNTLCTIWKRLCAQGFITRRVRDDFGTSRGVRYTLSPALEEVFCRIYGVAAGDSSANDIPEQVLAQVHSHMKKRTALPTARGEKSKCDKIACADLPPTEAERGRRVPTNVCPTGDSTLVEALCSRNGEDLSVLKELYAHHPEYDAWRRAGIPFSRLAGWLQNSRMDVLMLDAALRWFVWDCAIRTAQGASVEMAEEFDAWLCRGGFPRPEDYISYEESLLTRRETLLQEREALRKREDDLHRRSALVALREAYADILVHGEENAVYCSLRENLSDFARAQEHGPLRPVFEQAMWESLLRLSGLQDTAEY